MFGWNRKKTSAYRAGQNLANESTASLDRYMDDRFRPVFNGYLNVLRGNFEDCINPPRTSPEDYHHKAPPIILARTDYRNFLRELDELKLKMLGETEVAMSRWLEVADQVGGRDDFMRLIKMRIDDFQSNLTMKGLELFTEMAHRLKLAGDEWRAAHPQISAQFPPD